MRSIVSHPSLSAAPQLGRRRAPVCQQSAWTACDPMHREREHDVVSEATVHGQRVHTIGQLSCLRWKPKIRARIARIVWAWLLTPQDGC
jgi:hypothetical protein